jgi:hypothetical protein
MAASATIYIHCNSGKKPDQIPGDFGKISGNIFWGTVGGGHSPPYS